MAAKLYNEIPTYTFGGRCNPMIKKSSTGLMKDNPTAEETTFVDFKPNNNQT